MNDTSGLAAKVSLAVAKLLRESSVYMGFIPENGIDLNVNVLNHDTLSDVICRTPMGWYIAHRIQMDPITTAELDEQAWAYWNAGVEVVWWFRRETMTPDVEAWIREMCGHVLWVSFENHLELMIDVKQRQCKPIPSSKWATLSSADMNPKWDNNIIGAMSAEDITVFEAVIGYKFLHIGLRRLFEVWGDSKLSKSKIKNGLCINNSSRGSGSVFAHLHNKPYIFEKIETRFDKYFKVFNREAFNEGKWQKRFEGLKPIVFNVEAIETIKARAYRDKSSGSPGLLIRF